MKNRESIFCYACKLRAKDHEETLFVSIKKHAFCQYCIEVMYLMALKGKLEKLKI